MVLERHYGESIEYTSQRIVRISIFYIHTVFLTCTLAPFTPALRYSPNYVHIGSRPLVCTWTTASSMLKLPIMAQPIQQDKHITTYASRALCMRDHCIGWPGENGYMVKGVTRGWPYLSEFAGPNKSIQQTKLGAVFRYRRSVLSGNDIKHWCK